MVSLCMVGIVARFPGTYMSNTTEAPCQLS